MALKKGVENQGEKKTNAKKKVCSSAK